MRNVADIQPSQTIPRTYGRACIFLLSILSFQTLIPTEVLLTFAVLRIYKVHLEKHKEAHFNQLFLKTTISFSLNYIFIYLYFISSFLIAHWTSSNLLIT